MDILQTSVDNQIDEMIKNNKLDRFTSELQYATDTSRTEILRSIIKSLDGSLINTSENTLSKMDEFYKNVDKNELSKKWTRLTLHQKIDRIKHYCKKNKEDDNEKKYISMLNGNTLKCKYIDYDTNIGEIIDISIPVSKSKKSKKNIEKTTSE